MILIDCMSSHSLSFAVSVGLVVGAVASGGAMAIAPAVAVFVMGGVAIANIPYSAYKEIGIMKLPSKYPV